MSVTDEEMKNLLDPEALGAPIDDEESEQLLNPTELEDVSEDVEVTPVTRQAVYDDLIEREQELKTETVDPFGFIEEELGRREPLEQQRDKLERDKQEAFALARGVSDEFLELQKLKETPDNLRSPDLQMRISQLESDIDSAPNVFTTEEGEKYVIPAPAFADDPIAMMLGKSVLDISRGFASILGEDAKNAVPRIRDESDLVNVGSDMITLGVAGATGAAGAARLLSGALYNAPKWTQYITRMVGAPVGEALVTTEETPTFTEFETEILENEDLQGKLQILIEGTALNASTDALLTGLDKVGGISTITRVLNAIPAAIFSGDKEIQNALARSISDLTAQGAGATTKEERIKALEGINRLVDENFARNTNGASLTDYINADDLIKDAKKVATRGQRNEILNRMESGSIEDFDSSGMNLVDYIKSKTDTDTIRAYVEEFKPTAGQATLPTTGAPVVRESPEIAGAARVIGGVERGLQSLPEVAPRFIGRYATQEQVIERAATPTIPRAEAEEAGQRARAGVGEALERRVQAQRAETVEPLEQTLEEATQSVKNRLTPREGETGVSRETAQRNFLASRAYSADVNEVVRDSFLNARSTKNDKFREYGESIADIEIPATDVRFSISQVLDDLGIDRPTSLLLDTNDTYTNVFKRLVAQDRKLKDSVLSELQKRGYAPTDLDPENITEAIIDVRQSISPEEFKKVVDSAKTSIKYKDANLKDLEGLLQSINASKRNADTNTQIEALNRVGSRIENIILESIDDPAVLAQREEALEYFKAFSDLYKQDTGNRVFRNYKFGDKISSVELAQAQDNLQKLLEKVGTEEAPLTVLQTIRNNLEGQDLQKFDDAVENYFVSDIYSNVRTTVDPADPVKSAQNLAEELDRLAASTKISNLLNFSPNVTARVQGIADELKQSTSSVEAAQEALNKAEDQFKAFEKKVRDSSEAKFAEGMGTSDSVNAIQKIIADPDAAFKFRGIWNSLDEAGKEDLRATIGFGVLDSIRSGSMVERGRGEVSLDKINKFMSDNPVFQEVFPKGTPQRKNFELIANMAKSRESLDVRAIRESATGSIEDVGKLTSQLVNYIEGPLSVEGRRSRMAALVFFKLAGGPERATQILADSFLNLRQSRELFDRAIEIERNTGIPIEEAQKVVLGRYIIARFGFTDLSEFNRAVEGAIVESQMEEMDLAE
jgi:hypothetical protein